MPNVSVQNIIPNVGRSNVLPNIRISSFQTGRTGESLIAKGTPIGLLLVLTYAETTALRLYSDFRPNVKIKSQ